MLRVLKERLEKDVVSNVTVQMGHSVTLCQVLVIVLLDG